MPVTPTTPWLDRILGDSLGPVLAWLGKRALRRGDRHEFNHILSAVLHGNSTDCTPDHCTLQEPTMVTALSLADVEKLTELTRLLDEAYDHYLATSDGYRKSNEGHIELTLGDYDQRAAGEAKLQLKVRSSIFGRSSTTNFTSIEEALAEVARWHEQEMADTQADLFATDGPADPDCPHGPDEPCTCDGCHFCDGHVVGCTCDINWDALAERRLGL